MRTMEPGEIPQINQALFEAQGEKRRGTHHSWFCVIYDPTRRKLSKYLPMKIQIYQKKAKQDFPFIIQNDLSPEVLLKIEPS